MNRSKDHFFKSSPVAAGILAADAPRFTILDVNDAYLEMMKLPADALLGKGVFEAYPDLDEDGAHGSAHLLHALEETLQAKKTVKVPLMKYDTLNEEQSREEKYWEAIYTPQVDENHEVGEILVEIAERTAEVKTLLGNPSGSLMAEIDLKFRNIFDLSSAGIALVSLEGKWLEVNPQVVQLLGYSRWELLKSDFQRYTHPEDVDEELENLQRLVDGEMEKYEAEKRFYNRSGKVIWTMITASLVRKDNGEPHYFVSHLLDITAKKEAELALTESQQRFSCLFSHNPDAVYSFDLEGRFLTANNACCRLVELPEEDLVGSLFLNFITFEDKRMAFEQFLKVCEGKPVAYRVRVVTSKGAVRHLEVSNMPIVLGEEVVGVYGIAKDITAQIKVENEIQEAKRKYEQLVTTLDGIVWESDENLNFTYVSPQVKEVLGYPQSKWYQTHNFLYELVMPKERQQTLLHLLGKIDEGKNFFIELMVQAANGQEVWLRNNVTVVREPGRKTVLRGVMTDITAAKLAEKALETQSRKTIQILESIQDGFFALDKDWKVTYWNNEAEKLLGKGKEEMMERVLWEVFPEAKKDFYPEYQKAIDQQETLSFVKFSQPLGWFEESVYPTETGVSVYFKKHHTASRSRT